MNMYDAYSTQRNSQQDEIDWETSSESPALSSKSKGRRGLLGSILLLTLSSTTSSLAWLMLLLPERKDLLSAPLDGQAENRLLHPILILVCMAILNLIALVELFQNMGRLQPGWLRISGFLIALELPFLPFLILGMTAILTLSGRFVIKVPGRSQLEISGHCSLCDTCQGTIRSSRLLHGSRWLLIRSVERQAFHDAEGLLESKGKCHLCALLYNSIIPTTYGTIHPVGGEMH